MGVQWLAQRRILWLVLCHVPSALTQRQRVYIIYLVGLWWWWRHRHPKVAQCVADKRNQSVHERS